MDGEVLATNNRIGFHYFPDTLHYQSSDLAAWLPELKALGARWLTLHAPLTRAIPEEFIGGLRQAGIQPVLHFHITPSTAPSPSEISPLFQAYAKWGVKYITLFNRPNCKDQWESSEWAQENLVERFLDIYLPLAKEIMANGMVPVFPPLEPGGDYWDTAFLRTALKGMRRRGAQDLLSQMVLGAYAWSGNLPIHWGAGGPERWPGTRPYYTPPGEEDQLGFRIFDWYNAISQVILDKSLPIILLGAGSKIGDQTTPEKPPVDKKQHTDSNLEIARQMSQSPLDDSNEEPIPANVLACNFAVLSAHPKSKEYSTAWYREDGSTLPVVAKLKAWTAAPKSTPEPAVIDPEPEPLTEVFPAYSLQPAPPAQPAVHITQNGSVCKGGRLIKHYLLLPHYDWGVSDWHLEVTRNFIKKHKPTVGFSVDEALQSEQVTIIGGASTFPRPLIQRLEDAGCIIRQIEGDGTSIASQLETL